MKHGKDDSFKEFVRDQLKDLHGIAFRRMFGGYGIYAGSRFFGILHGGRLYFKTDAQSRSEYLQRGMDALRATAKQVLSNYYEVPADILEDPEVLIAWAQRSVAVAGTGGIRQAPASRRLKNR